MLWNLFEISINAYESFLMIYFLKSRLHIKEDSHLADILCLLSCTVFFQRPNQRSCCFHFSFDIRLCNGYRSFRSFSILDFNFIYFVCIYNRCINTYF